MLPEVREADATGDVAASYGRIRAALGIPVVNFVWRHLATIDGALAWAWPIVETAAPAIKAAVPELVREVDRELAEAGVGWIDLGIDIPVGAGAVIATYNRGNSWNMLAMTLLAAARLRPVDRLPAHRLSNLAAAEPAPAPVPPFPVYEGLESRLRAAIDRLAAAGPAAPTGVRPSLWVHLALWPEVLCTAADVCEPVIGSPEFAAAYANVFDRGAAVLGVAAPGPTQHGPTREEPIDRAIRVFRLRIAEMVLIGRLLAPRSGRQGPQGGVGPSE